MRIYVKAKGAPPFWIGLPTRFVCRSLLTGRLSRLFQRRFLKEMTPAGEDMKHLCAEFLRMKQKYPHLVLVDVRSKDGEHVKIRL